MDLSFCCADYHQRVLNIEGYGASIGQAVSCYMIESEREGERGETHYNTVLEVELSRLDSEFVDPNISMSATRTSNESVFFSSLSIPQRDLPCPKIPSLNAKINRSQFRFVLSRIG